MDKIIKEILGSIPKFIMSFIELLQSPKKFVSGKANAGTQDVSDSLVFLGLSLVITYLITVHFKGKNSQDLFIIILQDGLWKLVIVVIASISLNWTWRILKREGSTVQFLVLNSYFFGVLSILTHAILAMADSLYSSNPNIANVLFVTCYLFTIIWGLISWNAYSQVGATNGGVSYLKSLILFFLIVTPFLFLGIIFRDSLFGGDFAFLNKEGIIPVIKDFLITH